MPATDHRYLIMNHLSTTFLITALVIIVHPESGVTASYDINVDQVAQEAKNRAVTIIEGPKYVEQPQIKLQESNTSVTPIIITVSPSNTTVPGPNIQPEKRPPSKPPLTPDKARKQLQYTNIQRPHYGHIQKIPPPRPYAKQPLIIYHSPNSIYKFPRVIPLPPHLKNNYFIKSRPLLYAASTRKSTILKSPKFSLPSQIVNGIRTDVVRPPKSFNMTISNTTITSTEATTTTKVLRTKRIWPKRVLDKENSTLHNKTVKDRNKDFNTNETDHDASESSSKIRYVYKNGTSIQSTRGYRPVTRTPKIKYTTPSTNFTDLKPNDWIPIFPSHYQKLRKPTPTPINKRSDLVTNSEVPPGKHTLYLQSFGLVPVSKTSQPSIARKKMVFFNRKHQLNPYVSGYSRKPVHSSPQYLYGDLQTDGSQRHPRVVTKIKHHHHHHHHKYIKTVEKPVKVPFKVEVPRPYPVQVEKKVPYPVEKIKIVERPVPYPVTVEKKVPYPIGIKVPHPVPVKVVEKEYVPKPYPIIHHVPVIKHVQVEKKVPYPVEVKVHVPIDRPVPVPVPVEKQVPYPVPVKVLVPQPYPVETKVPYPVHIKVKEPVEVIKHVHVKVPVPQPYPVKVFVEKRIPYPVEVEKKVPVPVEVFVPQRVEVEKRVPVYVPKPYPVEKKVPYPVKVPVKVPVQVPVEVPVYIHNPIHIYSDDYVTGSASATNIVTATPDEIVTAGNTDFQSRSDNPEALTTTAAPNS